MLSLDAAQTPIIILPPREKIIPVKKTFPAFCSFPLTLKAVIYFRCTVLVSIMSKICKTFVENKTSILNGIEFIFNWKIYADIANHQNEFILCLFRFPCGTEDKIDLTENVYSVLNSCKTDRKNNGETRCDT